MTKSQYTIRTMKRSEVDLAMDWAAAEGWNPGLNDAECYYAADPNGFLMGLLGDEPIATISVIKYGSSFGFLGFYMVKPEYRGKGYGIRIWNAGMEYLKGTIIGLDGVVAQQDNYKKSGFRLAHRNIRFEGSGGGNAPSDADIAELSSIPFDSLAGYEEPFFPENRHRFLKMWIGQEGSHALGIMRNGQLTGYGVIRPCRIGWKIGPLYADNSDSAETLFKALKSKAAADDPVYLDVPEGNRQAVELAERHGMKASFETARMYTKEKPDLPLDRIFGMTSFEIG